MAGEIVTLSEESIRRIKRELDEQKRELTNLRRHLTHVATRHRESVWMPGGGGKFLVTRPVEDGYIINDVYGHDVATGSNLNRYCPGIDTISNVSNLRGNYTLSDGQVLGNGKTIKNGVSPAYADNDVTVFYHASIKVYWGFSLAPNQDWTAQVALRIGYLDADLNDVTSNYLSANFDRYKVVSKLWDTVTPVLGVYSKTWERDQTISVSGFFQIPKDKMIYPYCDIGATGYSLSSGHATAYGQCFSWYVTELEDFTVHDGASI